MGNYQQFYIDGQWVDPLGEQTLEVINPATQEPIATIALANAQDVDRAVAAARRAFESFSQTSVADRLALLDKIISRGCRTLPRRSRRRWAHPWVWRWLPRRRAAWRTS
jgi:hypothetical protein